jgi:hypothetical protein
MRSIVARNGIFAGHPQQERQVPAGGIAPSPDPIGVDPVFFRVGAQKAHGAPAIVQRRRPRGFPRQPVIDCRRHEAEFGEVDNVSRGPIRARRGEARFVPLDPSAAVNHDNRRSRLLPGLLRPGQIERPIPGRSLVLGFSRISGKRAFHAIEHGGKIKRLRLSLSLKCGAS